MLLQLDSAAFDSLVKRLLPLFTASMCTKSNYTGTQFGIPACIVHGDLWAPNVLWEKDAEGRASDRLAAIIDWQCIHSGNPCEELQRILSVNTSGKYRRQNTERLLRFYTDKVAEHMADGRAPFTVEQATGTFFWWMEFLHLQFSVEWSIQTGHAILNDVRLFLASNEFLISIFGKGTFALERLIIMEWTRWWARTRHSESRTRKSYSNDAACSWRIRHKPLAFEFEWTHCQNHINFRQYFFYFIFDLLLGLGQQFPLSSSHLIFRFFLHLHIAQFIDKNVKRKYSKIYWYIH